MGLGEETWNDHESNRSNWTAWSTVIQQVHESDQLSLPSTHHSFVASGRCVEPDAPAAVERMRVGKWKTLRTQGVTHTHTLCVTYNMCH